MGAAPAGRAGLRAAALGALTAAEGAVKCTTAVLPPSAGEGAVNGVRIRAAASPVPAMTGAASQRRRLGRRWLGVSFVFNSVGLLSGALQTAHPYGDGRGHRDAGRKETG